jgi:hypothetical protein
LKEQAIPATVVQENVTLFAKPPAEVTVRMNCVDWPATTAALVGDAPKTKSALAMLMVTGVGVLAPNFSSPP